MKKFFAFFLAVLSLSFVAAQEMPFDLGTDEQEDLNPSDVFIDEINEINGSEAESAKTAENQREFIIVMSEQEFNLDPHTASFSSEAQILNALYEGLFSYNPKNLSPEYALCENYKISRDKKKWTFKIRENAEFSSGEKITAYTVKNSWAALLQTPAASYASLLNCISGAEEFRNEALKGNIDESLLGITVRDNTTLVVSLNMPTAHLPKILCHHAFAVCTENKGNGVSDGDFSGAFVIKEKTSDGYLLEKNEKYWDAENVLLPSIRIACANDASENSWKFNTGRADWISGIVDTNTLINKNAVRISTIFGTDYLFFSCKNGPWTDPDFRNALLTAVPWEILRKDSLVQAETLIFPLAGYPHVDGISETSLEDAQEMMAAARKKLGIKDEEKLSLTFGISAGSKRQKSQYEILKAAWEPLNVELNVQTTSEERYLDSISTWNADLFSYAWIGDFADPLAFLELFRENSTLNQTKWKNEKFSKLLDEACRTTDNGEHYKLLSQAEQTLLDDGMIIPISHSISLHALNLNAVGGWYTNALDIHPYKYLYFKEETNTIPNVVMR